MLGKIVHQFNIFININDERYYCNYSWFLICNRQVDVM